ncbi:hypothetical protein SDC9_107231 [bioreactor metagenome]|jgi:hypothetical protein|uniref:Uncharacterized protein n=1 Tax=bioreactor metagenome TaxID=1076179 RepID=A0A645B4J0_9ZZZZ
MPLALIRAFTEIRFCGFRQNRKTANVYLQISTIELLRFRVSTAFVEYASMLWRECAKPTFRVGTGAPR